VRLVVMARVLEDVDWVFELTRSWDALQFVIAPLAVHSGGLVAKLKGPFEILAVATQLGELDVERGREVKSAIKIHRSRSPLGLRSQITLPGVEDGRRSRRGRLYDVDSISALPATHSTNSDSPDEAVPPTNPSKTFHTLLRTQKLDSPSHLNSKKLASDLASHCLGQRPPLPARHVANQRGRACSTPHRQ